MKSIYIILIGGLLSLITLTGCSKDNEPESDIIGTWYAERSYYNPASGTKYQYLTITFEEDGTGEIEYEAPVSYGYGVFTYTVSGTTITCRGTFSSTNYDEPDTNYVLTLEIQGNALVPQNHFQDFILTRNGESIDNGNGNNSGTDTEQTDNMFKTIQDALNPKVSYKDYEFTISLNSSLENKLKGKDIKYYLQGYLYDYTTYTQKQIFDHEKHRVWGGFEDKYSFIYTNYADYSIFSDYVVKLDMYFESYKVLKNKYEMTTDEKALYNSIIKAMNNASPYSFHGEICVEVEGKEYNVFSYCYTPYNNSVKIEKLSK